MRITKELKGKILDYLYQNKMTQEEFAALFGIKHPSVNRWINREGAGLAEPHARKLCELLGLDYAAEMYRQHTGGHVAINIGGDNTQTSEARPNAHTLAEVIAAIMAADLPDADKLTTISTLSKIGIY